MNRKLKACVKFVLYYSPSCLQHRLQRIVEKRELQAGMQRMKRTKISKEELEEKINALNLGGDVMLHTSMLNIGKLQGGAKFIVQKLIDKIDLSENTLLVPALPFQGSFKKYLERKPLFDVRNAPVAMGAINEYIALLPGARRSMHPTHSVVALGAGAEEYTSTHHLDKTPFGEHSPYYKLIKHRTKVVLFGATLNNLTVIHAVEDLLGELNPFNVYDKKRYAADCIDKDGKHLTVYTTCHAPLLGMRRDASFLYDDMVRQGVMEVVPLGEAELCTIDAYKFCIFYLDKLASGCSIYGKFKPSARLKDYISALKKKI